MRVPARFATKDAFVSSIAVPTHPVTPGGGDGTFPPTTTPDGSIASPLVPVVNFRDLTTSATSWAWSFKSGSTELGTSSVQNPSFTFPGAGTYDVSLTTEFGTITHSVVVS